jgi:CP family cyanate transporter-like MFS transporter
LKKFNFLALLGILLTTLVLRPPVASVGPLVAELEAKLHLGSLEVGLLTSIPVFCFGLGAFASPAIVRRFGIDKTLLVLQALIAISIAGRLWFGFIGLLVGTTVIGLSIAVANVILPGIVRARFPERIGIVTATYTMTLAAAASFAASTAVPVSVALGGWQFSLMVWVVPAVAAFLVWSTQTKDVKHVAVSAEHHELEAKSVRRSPITWWIVAFFGIQSLGFYALLAWLPSLLIDGGSTAAEAGGVLGVTTIAGVPFGMLLGSNLKRFKSLSVPAAIASGLTMIGMSLLLDTKLALVAGIIIGLGQASTFPISLNLISTRATTVAQTTELSTLSQGYGYLAAALGTFVFGWLRDISGSWVVPILLLVLLSALQLYSGLVAGRNRVIENPAA